MPTLYAEPLTRNSSTHIYRGQSWRSVRFLLKYNTYASSSFNLRGSVNDVDSLRSGAAGQIRFRRQRHRDNSKTARNSRGNHAQGTGGAVFRKPRQATRSSAGSYAGHGTRCSTEGLFRRGGAIVPHENDHHRAHLVSNAAIQRHRARLHEQTGWPAAPTSPRLRTVIRGLMYPGRCRPSDEGVETGIINRVIDVSLDFSPPQNLDARHRADGHFRSVRLPRRPDSRRSFRKRYNRASTGRAVPFNFVLRTTCYGSSRRSRWASWNPGSPEPIAALVAPHVQMPVMATRPGWKERKEHLHGVEAGNGKPAPADSRRESRPGNHVSVIGAGDPGRSNPKSDGQPPPGYPFEERPSMTRSIRASPCRRSPSALCSTLLSASAHCLRKTR